MKIFFLSFFICICSAAVFSQAKYRDEFNGPFPSWANVKTRFRAAGDGIADDTKALQAAIDSLTCPLIVPFNTNEKTKYMVVYLPAGTYRISQSLHMEGKIGVTLIGEDPGKTIIKWYGGDNDTMFVCNRSNSIKISRLTWNANEKKNIEAIGLHYKDFNPPNFSSTGAELTDMIFIGRLLYGISGGTYKGEGTGIMDSECTIKRCKFYSCTGAGIYIKGFNALDYWVWDCEFNACNTGVYCTHGNYHIYASRFNNSAEADLKNKDVPYLSVRASYSNNAGTFSLDEGSSCNTFKRIFQGNIVENYKSTPVQYHHLGKITLLDNYFYSEKLPQNVTVDYTSWCRGNYDILSVNNSYSLANPNNLRKDFPSKVHSIQDKKYSSTTTKKPSLRPLQPFLPYVKRKVFEVPANAGTAAIQKIMNKAAALKGERAIVHFALGLYALDRTLEVPAGSDIQLIGDGILDATVFTKTGRRDSDFYFFTIQGPSYITVKDIQLGQDGNPDKTNGFLFVNIDQTRSEARIDQLYSNAAGALLIDGLNNTYFEKNNSFFSKGNVIIGGDQVKLGKGTSRLYCFGGQSAGVHLENNATMVAKDCWWEGSLKRDFIPQNLSGYGNLTVDGALYAPIDMDSGTVVNISNYKGKISLLNVNLMGSIFVQPNAPGLKMLAWNVSTYYKRDPMQFMKQKLSSQIAMIGISSQCFKSADRGCPTEDAQSVNDVTINVPDLDSFMNELTNDDRKALPRPYTNLSTGVSNIYVSRVCVYTGTTAFTFRK